MFGSKNQIDLAAQGWSEPSKDVAKRIRLNQQLYEQTMQVQEVLFELQLEVERGQCPSVVPCPESSQQISFPPAYPGFERIVPSDTERRVDLLQRHRTGMIEGMIALNPFFKPPADYTTQHSKRTCLIPLPVHKFPTYNFSGHIIGPRGATAKALADQTGTLVAIRSRRDSDFPDHVRLEADNEASLYKALYHIRNFVVPKPDELNVFKQEQLRQLADMIEGDDQGICPHCGGPSKDHRPWQCPQRHVEIPPWRSATAPEVALEVKDFLAELDDLDVALSPQKHCQEAEPYIKRTSLFISNVVSICEEIPGSAVFSTSHRHR